VHGADAARIAEEVSRLLFAGGDPAALSPAALEALTREIPSARYVAPADAPPAGGADPGARGGVDVAECLVLLGLAASRGAVKRLLEQGGVSANGQRLGAGDRTVPRERLLRGRWLLLRKGAREYGLVDAA
jgi:tyrosyl-tRNA synthetase